MMDARKLSPIASSKFAKALKDIPGPLELTPAFFKCSLLLLLDEADEKERSLLLS
jgi:hypothetical protein